MLDSYNSCSIKKNKKNILKRINRLIRASWRNRMKRLLFFSSKKLTYSAEMYEQKGSGLISNPKLCFVTVKARVGTSF